MAAAAPKAAGPPQAAKARDELVSPDISPSVGSLGSAVVAIAGGSPAVFDAVTGACWDKYRRGWQDLRAGLAVFMAPSGPHEGATNDAAFLICALADAMRIPVASLRSRTIKTDQGRADPDESFLIGDLAAEYLSHQRPKGTLAADEWFESTNLPPDLVVDVEYTHHNATKQGIYRAAGVSELWELSTGRSNLSPRIITFDGGQGHFDLAESHVLPGVRPASIPDAIQLLNGIGQHRDFAARLARGEDVDRRLLDIAAGLPDDSDNDAGGSPAGP